MYEALYLFITFLHDYTPDNTILLYADRIHVLSALFNIVAYYSVQSIVWIVHCNMQPKSLWLHHGDEVFSRSN